MEEGRSYIPPVKIGQVMRAVGIGEVSSFTRNPLIYLQVIESKHPNFQKGDIASGDYFP